MRCEELSGLGYDHEDEPVRSFQQEFNNFVELKNHLSGDDGWQKLIEHGECDAMTEEAISVARTLNTLGEAVIGDQIFYGPEWRFIASRCREEIEKIFGRKFNCDNDPLMLRFIYRERRTGRLFYTKPKKDIPNFHGNPVPQKFIEKIYIDRFLPLKEVKAPDDEDKWRVFRHFIAVSYAEDSYGPHDYHSNKLSALSVKPQVHYVVESSRSLGESYSYDMNYIDCE